MYNNDRMTKTKPYMYVYLWFMLMSKYSQLEIASMLIFHDK